MQQLVEFEWSRCIDHYRLDDPKEPTGIESTSHRWEIYRPLSIDDPLFVRFAIDTPATPKGMLDFCNRFGIPTGRGSRNIPWRTKRIHWVELAVLLAYQKDMRHAFNLFEKGNNPQLLSYWNSEEALALLRIRLCPGDPFSMVWAPFDLMQAMWVQFALHICSYRQILRCQYCNEPVMVGPGSNRRSTFKYHNECRHRAWHSRQKGK